MPQNLFASRFHSGAGFQKRKATQMNIQALQRYLAAAKPWVLAHCHGHADGCSCDWCRLEEEISDASHFADRIISQPSRRFRVQYRHQGGPILRRSDLMTREAAEAMAGNLNKLWRYAEASVIEEATTHGGDVDHDLHELSRHETHPAPGGQAAAVGPLPAVSATGLPAADLGGATASAAG